ncbi:MAG: MerR family DNA-binding protein [Thermoanaerobaculia bacterium]
METLTIGQVAKRTGIGVEAIRFYEQRHLLERPRRRLSGYREYTPEVIERLRFIRRAQELGFSLKEIAELLSLDTDPDTSCAEVRHLAETKLSEIEGKIADLKRMRRALGQVVRSCRGEGPASGCPILHVLQPTTPRRG